MIKKYVESVLALHQSGMSIDDVLHALQKVLDQNGHRSLYVKILKEVARKLEQKESELTPLIITASQAGYEKHKADIYALLEREGVDRTPVIRTDDSLIGGYVVRFNNTIVDRSYKRKLRAVYESLTR